MAASSRSPFGHSLRSCPLSPARGDSFWVVLPPACPERGGGCEQSEQTEGLNRGCACIRQPLSQSASRRISSSPAGEPFGAPTNLTRSHAFGVFHMAKPYFTAHQRNFTLRKQDFTADESPLYPIPTTSAPIFSMNAQSCSTISIVGRFFFINSSSCMRLSRSM